MRDKPTEFTECDTCRAKPGSPLLCSGCLANRELIGRFQKLVAPVGLEEADKQFREWLKSLTVFSWQHIADKAAEIFAGVQDSTTAELEHWLRATEIAEVPDLKATIARLEGEVAELKAKLEPCDGCGLPELHKMCIAYGTDVYMNREHPAWGNAAAMVRLLIEAKSKQPEIIIGKGQAVTEEQQGRYVFQRADGQGSVETVLKLAGSLFDKGYRYMRCPTFPPRPTFTPPPNRRVG